MREANSIDRHGVTNYLLVEFHASDYATLIGPTQASLRIPPCIAENRSAVAARISGELFFRATSYLLFLFCVRGGHSCPSLAFARHLLQGYRA